MKIGLDYHGVLDKYPKFFKLFIEAMKDATQDTITIIHNKVPNRIRFRVPLIKHQQTFADLLKQTLLRDEEAKGIYHADPDIVTNYSLEISPRLPLCSCFSKSEGLQIIVLFDSSRQTLSSLRGLIFCNLLT